MNLVLTVQVWFFFFFWIGAYRVLEKSSSYDTMVSFGTQNEVIDIGEWSICECSRLEKFDCNRLLRACSCTNSSHTVVLNNWRKLIMSLTCADRMFHNWLLYERKPPYFPISGMATLKGGAIWCNFIYPCLGFTWRLIHLPSCVWGVQVLF